MARPLQVTSKELNASEPPMRCRKKVVIRKHRGPLDPLDKCGIAELEMVARTESGIEVARPLTRRFYGTGEVSK